MRPEGSKMTCITCERIVERLTILEGEKSEVQQKIDSLRALKVPHEVNGYNNPHPGE